MQALEGVRLLKSEAEKRIAEISGWGVGRGVVQKRPTSAYFTNFIKKVT